MYQSTKVDVEAGKYDVGQDIVAIMSNYDSYNEGWRSTRVVPEKRGLLFYFFHLTSERHSILQMPSPIQFQ